MQPTVYQKPELRDANDNIIQQGAFGKNTALCTATNDGWIDYVANNLEFLYGLAKDEVVPVPSLPASGQTNKTYLLTTTGVSYRWSGTQWVAVSSSEAVGRAETAANLAEQWATKTDGTVDGTEYSAKYYAGLAEASADDAQDVADDMADHLVQIDKNTGGVAKNSKRISNIEKLLQGNLYDYDTDDDSAYVKDVPSGALPYAGIEKIGGKTIVYHQILPNTSSRTEWEAYTNANLTLSFNDNVLNATINISSTGGYTVGVRTGRTSYPGYRTIAGHKYYISYTVKSDMACAFGDEITGDSKTVLTISNVDTWYKYEAIRTPQSYEAGWKTGLMRPAGIEGANLQGMTYSVKEPILIDLTLMFGSGNEPTTVAEFEAMFPADYYPYNAGTLLSAGVTEVVSHSNNLANPSIFMGAVSGASYTDGYWTCTTLNLKSAFNNNGTNNSPVFNGNTLTISFDIKHAPSSSTDFLFVAIIDPTTNTVIESSSIAFTNTWQHFSHTYTNGANGCKVFLSYGTGRTINIKNFKIEENASETPYSSYGTLATMPIPAEVRALDGYGWSAGTAYNYVDFERKVFVQNVGRVDLGTLNWIYNNNVYGQYFSTTMNTKKDGLAGFVCAKYETFGGGVSSITSSTGIAQSESQLNAVYIVDPAYTNASAFKSAMSGVYAYYQLATPVETDISQYLTDNIIEVGAGGTLTFENSNGDDYHIPVPSEVTYMIDLQEAIENGN